jgi:hypothetical protein
MSASYPPPQPGPHYAGPVVDAVAPKQPTGLRTLVVVFLLVGAAVLFLLAIGAGAWYWFVAARQGPFTIEEIRDRFGDHNIIQFELGNIDECKYDYLASLKASNDKIDAHIYHVAGPQGKGDLVIRVQPDSTVIVGAGLRVENNKFERPLR